MTAKEILRQLVDRLPEDATLEDVQYELHVLQKIQAGMDALAAGQTLPHDKVMEELARWLK